VDASRLDAALEALTRGHYTVDLWTALELRRRSCQPAAGFNDVVLRRAAGARPVAIALGIEAELLARYSGDGLIVATAQGSTAYSFAAGGPIVSRALAAQVVTPLAPRATFNRPLVLSAGEFVELDSPMPASWTPEWPNPNRPARARGQVGNPLPGPSGTRRDFSGHFVCTHPRADESLLCIRSPRK
jgi:NAD kinase